MYFSADLSLPILGICVGAQFIALNSGSIVGKAIHPEYGKKKVTFSRSESIFTGIPRTINAWESHNDEIKDLPDEYILCASSDTCKVQAFYHKTKDIFAVQFHPEVNNTEYGNEIFKNFINVCLPGIIPAVYMIYEASNGNIACVVLPEISLKN